MIDTTTLLFRENQFVIFDHARFSPSTEGFYKPEKYYQLGGRASMQCVQNPTKSELKNGIYKPCLTVSKRMLGTRFETTLKVQFSAPKLLFGNNFDEVEDCDFDKIVDLLYQRLKEMGVRIFSKVIRRAFVSGIHYSKNIPLTDGSIPYMYLKEIGKCNVSKRLDFNKTDFRNEGQILKFHTNSFEIVFYDKIKDFEKAVKISEKRAEEKEYELQLGLFDEIQHVRQKQPFELFRMEIRLNRAQKIRDVLKRVGIKTEPTFENLFKKSISQKVLSFYWSEIKKSYPAPLFQSAETAKEFLSKFMINNPKEDMKTNLLAFGFKKAVGELGIRETRELFKQYPQSTWYRLFKEINGFDYSGKTIRLFDTIENQINQFNTFKNPKA